MRIKRLLVGAIGTALVVASPLAFSTTAHSAGAADDGFAAYSAPADTTPAADSADTAITGSQPAARQRADYTSRLKMDKQSRSIYKHKQKIVIAGQIQAKGEGCASGGWCFVNLPGDSVRLSRKIAGTKKFRKVGIAYGDTSGRFTFTTRSAGKAVYRLKYSGIGVVPPAQSKKKIKGSRNAHAKAFKRGGKIYTKGNVSPGWGNKNIIIQRKTSPKGNWGNWRSVRTNRKGAFQARLYSPRTGSFYYRVKVPASGKRWNAGTDGGWRVYRY